MRFEIVSSKSRARLLDSRNPAFPRRQIKSKRNPLKIGGKGGPRISSASECFVQAEELASHFATLVFFDWAGRSNHPQNSLSSQDTNLQDNFLAIKNDITVQYGRNCLDTRINRYRIEGLMQLKWFYMQNVRNLFLDSLRELPKKMLSLWKMDYSY